MYKEDKIITTVVLGVIGGAVLTALAMWVMYRASLDPNAVYDTRTGELTWNDAHYVEVSGDYSALTKTLARIDYDVCVMEVAEDPDHDFVAVSTWDETFLMVREDYVRPINDDAVTAFLWGDRYVTDKAACAALEAVLTADGDTVTYDTDNWFAQTETQRMEQLYIARGGCPVATGYQGFMGTVDDRFMVTAAPVAYEVNDLGETVPQPTACYEVDTDTASILLPYLV